MGADVLGFLGRPAEPRGGVGKVAEGDVGVEVFGLGPGRGVVARDRDQGTEREAGLLPGLAAGRRLGGLEGVDAAGDGLEAPGLGVAAGVGAGAELLDDEDAVADGIVGQDGDGIARDEGGAGHGRAQAAVEAAEAEVALLEREEGGIGDAGAGDGNVTRDGGPAQGHGRGRRGRAQPRGGADQHLGIAGAEHLGGNQAHGRHPVLGRGHHDRAPLLGPVPQPPGRARPPAPGLGPVEFGRDRPRRGRDPDPAPAIAEAALVMVKPRHLSRVEAAQEEALGHGPPRRLDEGKALARHGGDAVAGKPRGLARGGAAEDDREERGMAERAVDEEVGHGGYFQRRDESSEAMPPTIPPRPRTARIWGSPSRRP